MLALPQGHSPPPPHVPLLPKLLCWGWRCAPLLLSSQSCSFPSRRVTRAKSLAKVGDAYKTLTPPLCV